MSNVTVSMKMSPKATGTLYMKNIKNEKRIEELEEAVKKAHEILLHEVDKGRTPSMLQGVGLGYFEDIIAGID